MYKDNKKTALPCAKRESGEGDLKCRTAFKTPSKDVNTESENRQQGQVESLLDMGKENAKSPQYIAALIGCSSTRQLRSIITAEREAGATILSSSTGGYFLPSEGEKGIAEIQKYIATITAHGESISRSIQIVTEQLERQKAINEREKKSGCKNSSELTL